jgi:hypothetical protein
LCVCVCAFLHSIEGGCCTADRAAVSQVPDENRKGLRDAVNISCGYRTFYMRF